MEFAKQELAKYGWTEGKGLGLKETGIVKALKPQLKFDKAGMGHNAAETFTNHWWEKAFNAAANNITINKYVDGSVTVDAEGGYEINDHKGYSKKRKHLVYDNFIKTSTLTKEGAITDEPREAVEVPSVAIVPILTDEELFRACGGRTAHKGARHGLGLNGKLARIEQQEKLLLNLSEKVSEDLPPSKKKKSKKSSKSSSNDLEMPIQESLSDKSANKDPMIDICSENIDDNECMKKEKKKKKKKKKKPDGRIEEIISYNGHFENLSEVKETEHKKSKRPADVYTDVGENVQNINLDGEKVSRKKSKKSDKEENAKQETEELIDEKLKKHKKIHRESKDAITEEQVDAEKTSKKSKKSVIPSDPGKAIPEIVLSSVDKREKRKKRKCVTDEALNPSSTCLAVDSEMSENVPTKKKSRKKKMTE